MSFGKKKDRGETHINRRNQILVITGIGIVVSFLIGTYLATSVTESVPYQVPYQDPVYKTYYYQDPVYRTENYQEAIYGTLYYGTLTHIEQHLLGLVQTYDTKNFDNAVSYTQEYSGGGYTFTMTNFDGTKNYYYNINTWSINTKPGVTGYETKSRQVLDHYETNSKQVIDHYDTKYRTEYKDVTKTRFEWFLNNS